MKTQKHPMSRRWLLAAGFLLGGSIIAAAQTPAGNTDSLRLAEKKQEIYREQPVWIDMQQDPDVNYYEAREAFKEFWKERKEPEGEFEEKEHKKKTLFRKIFAGKQLRLEEESESYALEYKKFKNWLRENEPYVQPDGHILSQDERLELWKKQRQN